MSPVSPCPLFRPRPTAFARPVFQSALVLAVFGAMLVELLHGHGCTSDGCLVCLVAHCAQAALLATAGVVFALPQLRPLHHVVRVCARIPMPPRRFAPGRPAVRDLSSATPVGERIMLLV